MVKITLTHESDGHSGEITTTLSDKQYSEVASFILNKRPVLVKTFYSRLLRLHKGCTDEHLHAAVCQQIKYKRSQRY